MQFELHLGKDPTPIAADGNCGMDPDCTALPGYIDPAAEEEDQTAVPTHAHRLAPQKKSRWPGLFR